jgi:hypothetical protein
MTVVREIARYKLDLVGVKEVRWDCYKKGIIYFSKEKETKIINWEQDPLYTRE